MSVHCAHCGEELMGAVNRCWKCGQMLVSHSGPVDVPPIRRGPVELVATEALEATILEEPVAADQVRPAFRRGSPFQKKASLVRLSPRNQTAVPKTPEQQAVVPPSNLAAPQLASVVSVGLAAVALALSFAVPIATLVLALVALPIGIWGLFGHRRGTAAFGLVLGCVALAWGAFSSLVQIYQMIYGVHPFA